MPAWTPLTNYLGPPSVQKQSKLQHASSLQPLIECHLLLSYWLKQGACPSWDSKGWRKGFWLQGGLAKNFWLLSLCILSQVQLCCWVGKGGTAFIFHAGYLTEQTCNCGFFTKHPLSCWEVNCRDCAMMLFGKESHPSSWWDGNKKPLALGDVERLSEAETRQLETVSVKVCTCLMPDDDARDELICAALLPGFQFLWAREKYWIIINRLL